MHPASWPSSVLITGASSGIGEALANAYAEAGASLALSGRSERRLEAVAAACRAKGATVNAAILDVQEKDSMQDWIQSVDEAAPLDLVIANAGISGGTGGGGEPETQARAIFAINIDGMLNTLHPAIARMQNRGQGQIALMSSLAGFRGFAG
ncbi:MAG TPA: short-chain dehydrogenase, partial [Rhodospirillaceae bacterium]|nr:short-chain dehydrogenase [Rhodospirillaceae bacterium]